MSIANLFKSLGASLIGILIYWIISGNYASWGSDFGALPSDIRFHSSADFSPEAQAAISKVKLAIDSIRDKNRIFNVANQLSVWIGFAATAISTLLAGIGKSETQETNTTNILSKAKWMGFLAAIASVCTLAAAQTGKSYNEGYADVQRLRVKLSENVQSLKDHPELEKSALDDLDALLDKKEI